MPVPSFTLTGPAVTGVHADGAPYRLAVAELPVTIKLGRKAPTRQAFVPRFAAYLKLVEGAAPPAKVDYYTKAALSVARMYLNDQLGDCVIAGKFHGVGAASANDAGAARVGPDSEVAGHYRRICGPGDNGCVITDVLDDMVAGRFTVGGDPARLDGYVSIDWTNKTEVMAALALFGWLVVGVNLPDAWRSNSVWDVTNSRIVGGHDITALGYDEKGVYVASWGRIYLVTWAAFLSRQWVEELYAPLGPDWYGPDKLAPSGVDLATLQADLALLKQGQVPPFPDPVPVGPPPPPPAPPVPKKDPVYDVKLSGWFGTMAGTATPRPASLFGMPDLPDPFAPNGFWIRPGAPAAAVNPVAVIQDLFAVYQAYQTGSIPAVEAAVKKLLADLGVIRSTAAWGDGSFLKGLLDLIEKLLPVILPLILK